MGVYSIGSLFGLYIHIAAYWSCRDRRWIGFVTSFNVRNNLSPFDLRTGSTCVSYSRGQPLEFGNSIDVHVSIMNRTSCL